MTTWKEIKDRVELKIGEEVDTNAFIIFANSAASELNDISYVEAPQRLFKGDKLRDVNDEVTVKREDMQMVGNIYTLPFYYFKYTDTFEWTSDNEFVEVEEYGESDKSNQVLIKNISSMQPVQTFTFKVIDDEVGVDEYSRWTYKYKIELPDNFNSVIRVEAKKLGGQKLEVERTSLNDYTDNDVVFSMYGTIVYKVNDGKLYILSEESIESVNLKYTKNMDKINGTTSLNTVSVEIEDSYANMIVYSIVHKWYENYLGIADAETTAIYQKYAVLKNEFELVNVAKRRGRVQSKIRIFG